MSELYFTSLFVLLFSSDRCYLWMYLSYSICLFSFLDVARASFSFYLEFHMYIIFGSHRY